MKKLIIDTDPGIDDAIAILLALAAGEACEVLALTTVNGNAPVRQTTENAFKILEVAERADIPVYKGSAHPLSGITENSHFHGGDGLGNLALADTGRMPQTMEAADFLIQAARTYGAELTLVAIGPLTNLALAIGKDPGFAGKIKELIVMGGAEHGGNVTPYAEFNFHTDPDAAALVFSAGFCKLTMVGLDATGDVFLTPVLRELVYLAGTRTARFIHRITRVYADAYWKEKHRLGCELCDVLAIAYLLNPDVVKTVPAYVWIETKGERAGESLVIRTDKDPKKRCNCLVATGAYTERFFQVFFTYLFPEVLPFLKEVFKGGEMAGFKLRG